MKTLLFPVILLLTSQIIAQASHYNFDSYTLEIDSLSVKAYSTSNTLFYSKLFSNINDNFVDLDGDGIDELLIIDKSISNNNFFYTAYIYNTIDTIYLVDSISSGRLEPSIAYSEDIGGTVIAAGMPDFDSLITPGSIFSLPLNFWKYEDGALFIANASIYDLFIKQNEELVDEIENYLNSHGEVCKSSVVLKSIIASAYINYLSAGEKTIASQFLKKYYLCSNIDNFKSQLVGMFNNQ